MTFRGVLARAFVVGMVVGAVILSPGWTQTTSAYLQSSADTTDTTSYTFNGVNFGAADADRSLFALVSARKSGSSNCSLSSASLGGVSTSSNLVQATSATNCTIAAIVRAAVPTGTSGTVVLTFPATMLRVEFKLVRVTGARSLTQFSTSSSAANDPTGSLSVRAHGFGLGVAATASNTTVTWSGLTKADEVVTESALTSTAAILAPTTHQTGLTVTADFASSLESAGIWASWAPNGPAAAAPTHYVTDSGSASGECAQGDPCTVTRAAAICGGDLMPPGSWANLADGVYSQAGVTLACNATQAFPIKFVGASAAGVRFTGTRTSLPAASWSLTSGRTYTYEAVFDNVALYDVTNVAQRPPVSTWVPIEVDDRQSPFSTPSGRIFSLDFPVRYTPRTSVNEVEAQHCTFFHSSAADRLYIHPCREQVPTDADNLYAGSTGWGTVTVTGDDLWLENVQFEQTTGQGLKVDQTANRFTGRNLTGLASQVWVEGTNFDLSGVTAKYVAEQGAADPNCYSSQYGGANGRSCWNDGGNGYQALFGRQGSATPSGTVRNGVFGWGWNGIRVDGAVTLDGATVWGLPNHAAQYSGTGGTIRNYQCANTQDCLYLEGESFNNLTVERSLFFGGVLFWCSRDGATQGGVTCPTSWTFQRNIFGSMVLDTLTNQTMVSDCNVGIPRSPGQSSLVRVTQVDNGGGEITAVDMAAWQAASTDDDNSVGYASTAWTDRSIFDVFSNQQNALDFTLSGAGPLTVCGVRAGPDTLNIFSARRRFRFRTP